MGAVNREKADQIADDWGLSAEVRSQLLDQQGAASQIITIDDALHRIFQDREQANAWPSKPNRAFQGQSALELILGGDIEQVRKHLQYHLFNGY